MTPPGTWVKIDDLLNENKKVRGVSLAARWTYIASICRSGNTLSDGEVLKTDLNLVDGTPKIAKELVTSGLWETRPTGWYVHDYLVYNRSRAQIEDLRKTNAENGAKRLANRSPNGSAIRSQKHPENSSDSLPQNARSATSANPKIPNPEIPDPPNQQKQQRKASDSLSDSLSETDEAVGRLCRVWEQATGSTVTAQVGDSFAARLERMPEEWVADGIREMGQSGAKALRYLNAILDRWAIEGREEAPSAPTDAFKRSAAMIAAARERMA